jgi:hypothetical protein
LRVWDLGLRYWGLGFWVRGSGLRVERVGDKGFWGLGFIRVYGFRVWGLGFRVWG